MKKSLLSLVVLGSLAYSATIAEKNQWLSPGLNISGLEAPKEGDWGPKLTEELFAVAAQKGFKGVRIPIKWSNHALTTAPFTIDQTFFNRIDTIVAWSRKYNLTMLLNMHHYDEIFVDPAGHETRFLSLWTQIADHYKNASDSVFFEILNEPHDSLTTPRWNALYPKALAEIRKTNPTRPVFVGTADWGGPSGLASLIVVNDPNLIATFHYYSPFPFTHQGASWSPGADAHIGTRWTGTDLEKMQIANDLKAAQAWSQKTSIPVHMGEFGAYGLHADTADRALWTAQVARQAEDLGFSWNYWEMHQGFGVYNVSSHSWSTPLLNALLSTDKSILAYNANLGGTNFLQNGDFAAAGTHWTAGVWNPAGKATFSFANQQFTVNTTQIPPQSYNIQLMQTGLAITAGRTYIVKYKVRGDGKAQYSLGLVGGADVNYAYYGGTGVYTPQNTWTDQVHVISVNQSNPNATLSFSFGSALGQIELDEVSFLEQGTPTPVMQKSEYYFSCPTQLSLKYFDLKGAQIAQEKIQVPQGSWKLTTNMTHPKEVMLVEVWSPKGLLGTYKNIQ